MHIGIVGAGVIAHIHAHTWRELGGELSIYSRADSSAFATQYDATAMPSFDDLLAEVDVVDICSPSDSHADYALQAVDAGRNVICEKPVALDPASAWSVARAARTKKVQIYPAHVVRYFSTYSAVQAAVAAGRVGNLTALRFSRAVPAPTRDWFFRPEQSGGLVFDLMVHDFDIARWLAGEVASVFATQTRPAPTAGKDDRTVAVDAVLTHQSGAVSVVHGMWGAVGSEFATSFHVTGERGRLGDESSASARPRQTSTRSGGSTEALPAAEANPFHAELSEFATAFAGGPPPRVTYLDGIAAVEIAQAAMESIGTGKSCPVPHHDSCPKPSTMPSGPDR